MVSISILLTFVHRRHRHERYKELREYYHEQMTCVLSKLFEIPSFFETLTLNGLFIFLQFASFHPSFTRYCCGAIFRWETNQKTIRERVSKYVEIKWRRRLCYCGDYCVLKRKGRAFHHILSQGRLFPVVISSLSHKNIKNILKNRMETSN